MRRLLFWLSPLFCSCSALVQLLAPERCDQTDGTKLGCEEGILSVCQANVVLRIPCDAGCNASKDSCDCSLNFEASKVSLGNGALPEGLVSFDFDLDGDLDVLNADSGSDSVLVLINDGGVLSLDTQRSISAVGGAPVGLAVGDFDNDGDPDLVTANRGSNDLSVLTNNNSLFTKSASLSGDEPVAVDFAELNGDLALDIVAVNFNGSNLSVFFQSLGSFSDNQSQLLEETVAPGDATTGDFNQDGFNDVAFCTPGANLIAFFNGNGTSLIGPQFIDDQGTPTGIVSGDFNSDAQPDLATTNIGAHDVSVLLNDSGDFIETRVAVPQQDTGVIIASDLDGDQDLDLVSSSTDFTNTNLVNIFVNDGAGGYSFLKSLTAGLEASDVIAADLNGDFCQDLIVSNSNGGDLSVFLSAP